MIPIIDDIKAVRGNPLLALITNRGIHALLFYRLSHFLWVHKVFIIPDVLTRIIQILYGIDINYKATIGEGCVIIHGLGLVIGRDVIIGKNAKLYHGVTIGISEGNHMNGSFPIIGNDVMIGCGAKILGKVKIGNNVKIGANAVVMSNIPDNCLAVGVPAKVKIASN